MTYSYIISGFVGAAIASIVVGVYDHVQIKNAAYCGGTAVAVRLSGIKLDGDLEYKCMHIIGGAAWNDLITPQ